MLRLLYLPSSSLFLYPAIPRLLYFLALSPFRLSLLPLLPPLSGDSQLAFSLSCPYSLSSPPYSCFLASPSSGLVGVPPVLSLPIRSLTLFSLPLTNSFLSFHPCLCCRLSIASTHLPALSGDSQPSFLSLTLYFLTFSLPSGYTIFWSCMRSASVCPPPL